MSQSETLPPILPDVLVRGLSIVFCGTAAGPISAARGHYYAHPQNKFWKTLYETGLTPTLLAPADYKKLPKWCIGLTDIAKNVSGVDKDLPPQSLGRTACESLRRRIEEFKPLILAFTSCEAGKQFLGRKVRPGQQDEKIGPTVIWVLPSTSPAGCRTWDQAYWHQLARQVKLFSR